MENRRTLEVQLNAGEHRELLLDAGSMLITLTGDLAVRPPCQWLAEQVVTEMVQLTSECVWIADNGGWFEVNARSWAQFIVIPQDRIPVWHQVSQCLSRWMRTGTHRVERTG